MIKLWDKVTSMSPCRDYSQRLLFRFYRQSFFCIRFLYVHGFPICCAPIQKKRKRQCFQKESIKNFFVLSNSCIAYEILSFSKQVVLRSSRFNVALMISLFYLINLDGSVSSLGSQHSHVTLCKRQILESAHISFINLRGRKSFK